MSAKIIHIDVDKDGIKTEVNINVQQITMLELKGAKHIVCLGWDFPPLGVLKFNEVIAFKYNSLDTHIVTYETAIYAEVAERQSKELHKVLKSLTFRPKNTRELP